MNLSDMSYKEISILALVIAFQISESTTVTEATKISGFFVILSDVLSFMIEDMESPPESPVGE